MDNLADYRTKLTGIPVFSYLQVVQSIVESPEPGLPDLDSNGEQFTPEFHEFIGRCLKKEVRLIPKLFLLASYSTLT